MPEFPCLPLRSGGESAHSPSNQLAERKCGVDSLHRQIMKVRLLLPTVVVALFVLVDFHTYAQQSNKSSGASRTDEWLQFRGPNGAGVAEGFALPAEFNATKNLAWKTPVP